MSFRHETHLLGIGNFDLPPLRELYGPAPFETFVGMRTVCQRQRTRKGTQGAFADSGGVVGGGGTGTDFKSTTGTILPDECICRGGRQTMPPSFQTNLNAGWS